MAPSAVGRIGPVGGKLGPDRRARALEDEVARPEDAAQAFLHAGSRRRCFRDGASCSDDADKRCGGCYFEMHVLTEFAEGTEIFDFASSRPAFNVSPLAIALAMALASSSGIGSPV